jgi:hypothetical protein
MSAVILTPLAVMDIMKASKEVDSFLIQPKIAGYCKK